MANVEGQQLATPGLAAIDLDGTLLRSDGSISERTRDALAAPRSCGLTIVFVSARHPGAVAEAAREAGVGGFAICSNGATVYDLDAGRVVRERVFESETAAQLVRALRERIPGVLFAVESRAEIASEPEFRARGLEPAEGTRFLDALELVADRVTRVIVRHADYELDVLAALVREIAGDAATVVVPGVWTVELSAAG